MSVGQKPLTGSRIDDSKWAKDAFISLGAVSIPGMGDNPLSCSPQALSSLPAPGQRGQGY